MPDVFAQMTKWVMQEQEQSQRHQEMTNHGLFGSFWIFLVYGGIVGRTAHFVKKIVYTSKTLTHSEPCDPADGHWKRRPFNPAVTVPTVIQPNRSQQPLFIFELRKSRMADKSQSSTMQGAGKGSMTFPSCRMILTPWRTWCKWSIQRSRTMFFCHDWLLWCSPRARQFVMIYYNLFTCFKLMVRFLRYFHMKHK
jgi:hypothetical protein